MGRTGGTRWATRGNCHELRPLCGVIHDFTVARERRAAFPYGHQMGKTVLDQPAGQAEIHHGNADEGGSRQHSPMRMLREGDTPSLIEA